MFHSLALFLVSILSLNLVVNPAIKQDSVTALIDLTRLERLSRKDQLALLNKTLGKPVLKTEFYTTTKRLNGMEHRVHCEQFKYVTEHGIFICYFMDDTKKLGQFVFQPARGFASNDHKNLFLILGMPVPETLGEVQGIPGFRWYELHNYGRFTQIDIEFNQDHIFYQISIYIDRLS